MSAACARVNFPRLADGAPFYSPGCKACRTMESEPSQNFNERLSQWVANQGFWFQIRYSMTGSGTKGTAMFHLLRLGFRLAIFLLVAGAGAWIYLVKVAESEKFKTGLQTSIKEGLFASDAELEGFSRTQGQLVINRLACQGG